MYHLHSLSFHYSASRRPDPLEFVFIYLIHLPLLFRVNGLATITAVSLRPLFSIQHLHRVDQFPHMMDPQFSPIITWQVTVGVKKWLYSTTSHPEKPFSTFIQKCYMSTHCSATFGICSVIEMSFYLCSISPRCDKVSRSFLTNRRCYSSKCFCGRIACTDAQ